MNKAFTKETDQDDEPLEHQSSHLESKNYVTPQGFAALQKELRQLLSEERPKLVEVVSWAAGNGDRSENGDYIYGKKRLREIDRRIRYLTKRLDHAQVVDQSQQQNRNKVFFGATVTYKSRGEESMIQIVGFDEADLDQGKISWVSPIAKALLKAELGDSVEVETPAGTETLKILRIQY